jgi:multiple sugar transport system substrate-binding protein
VNLLRPMLAVTLVVLAAGCAGTDSDAVPTIRVQVSGEPEETAIYEAIAAEYNRTHGEPSVEIVAVADKDDHLSLLQTSFAAGEAPDAYLINYREYTSFVERGAVEPIGSLLEARAVDLNDYYPQPVEAFTRDGELQCMPQNASSLVVYVNTRLFTRAGITPPFEGWTFDEFRHVARRLTTNDVKGVYVEPSLIRLAPFAWSQGGAIVDDEVAPTRLTLDDPATVSALRELISLQAEGLMPTEAELAAQDEETRFMNGSLAMLLSSRKSTPLFREADDLDFDVVPLPAFDTAATILHSDAYCLSPGGNLDAAADFVAFATGKTGESIAALGGRTVPSLRSVAESGTFLDPTQEPAHSEVFLDGMQGMRRVPVIASWPEVEDVAKEYLTRAWYDADVDLLDLLDELARRTDPMFEAR